MILQNKKTLKKSSIQEINPFIYSIDNNLDPNICDQLISLFDIPSLQKYINEKEDLYTNEISKSLTIEDNIFFKDTADISVSLLVGAHKHNLKHNPSKKIITEDIFDLLKHLDDALFKSLQLGIQELKIFLDDKCFNMSKIIDRCSNIRKDIPRVSVDEKDVRFNDTFNNDTGYQIQKSGIEYKGFALHDDFFEERSLTYLWYLNDDFVGGETIFPYSNFHVKPKKGTLIMFPCLWTHSHIGLAPKDSYKYIATGWMNR